MSDDIFEAADEAAGTLVAYLARNPQLVTDPEFKRLLDAALSERERVTTALREIVAALEKLQGK